MSYDNKMRNGRAFGFTDSLVAAASLIVNENEDDRKDRIARSKEPEQLDEVSKEKLADYSAKASDARGHRNLSTKKVDNRHAGVKKASDKLAKEEVDVVDEQYLGTNDSEKLNGGKSKDPRFRSPGSHIDYHHRRAGGHEKSPRGEVDKHRFQVAKKLGYMKEDSTEEKDSDNPPFEGGKKVTGPSKDKFGNVIKNKAKHLAKQAMKDQQKEEVDESTQASHDHIYPKKQAIKWKVKPPAGTKNIHPDSPYLKKKTEDVAEAGMPSSVIKHKESLANLSDKEFHAKHGDKDKATLVGMARRHGYGKSNPNHYVNRASRGSEGSVDEAVAWDDEQFLDWITESTEEDWDLYLDSLTDAELAELEEGILGMVGRGIGSAVKKAMYNSKGEGRLSTAGRATSAERKTKRIQKKIDAVKKKSDDKNRLAKAKSANSIANQKLKAMRQKEAETDYNKPQTESKHLDPVGQEDGDINNNGIPNDKSDRYLKKRRATIKKAIRKDIDEAAPMATAKQQAGVDRIKRNIIKKKAAANESMSVHVKQDDKGTGYTVTKVGSKMKKHGGIKVGEKMSDTHIDDASDSGIKVHHEAVNEAMGDEKVRSSSQSAELAKHYYAKAKQAQQQGDTTAAAKFMSAAKSFYRKSEGMQGKEKAGTPTGQSEELGVAITYWNEAEVEEIEAAADIAEVRVTKAAKSEPEHIGMQMRKVISLGNKHQGVEFKNGSTDKVSPNTAHAAMNRYNYAKPGEKEELQKHMAHSHDALKHIAAGKSLSDSPAAKKESGLSIKSDPTQMKRHGVQSTSGHYN